MVSKYFYYSPSSPKIIVYDSRPLHGFFCLDFDFFERVVLSMQCPRSGVFWYSQKLSDKALFYLFKRKGLHKCVVHSQDLPVAGLPESPV